MITIVTPAGFFFICLDSVQWDRRRRLDNPVDHVSLMCRGRHRLYGRSRHGEETDEWVANGRL